MLSSIRGVVVFSVLAIALSTACDPLPNNVNSSSGKFCGLQLSSQVNGAELGLDSTQLANTDLAQSFQVSSQANVTSVTVRLESTTTSMPGSLKLTIESDAGTGPSGVPVGLAESLIAASTVKSGFNNYTFTFPSEITLASQTTYWIRLNQNAAIQNAIYWAATTQGAGTAAYLSSFEGWINVSQGLGTRSFLFSLGCQ